MYIVKEIKSQQADTVIKRKVRGSMAFFKSFLKHGFRKRQKKQSFKDVKVNCLKSVCRRRILKSFQQEEGELNLLFLSSRTYSEGYF